MKESIFNIITERKDGTALFFNSMRKSLIIMDARSYNSFKSMRSMNFGNGRPMPAEDAELIAQLKRGGFVVEDDMNELLCLKNQFCRAKSGNLMLRLYVVPVDVCNFACKYCYYAGGGSGKMPENVQDALLEFARKKLGGKRSLNVVWTGGEPTLAPDVIVRLSRGFMDMAKELGLEYTSAIFTNGYLLNREMARELRLYGINIAQFVLDGPRDVHDKRRPLSDGSGTFDVIMKNLEEISDVMEVAVRVNIDSTNSDARDILSLLNSLKQCGLPESTIIELAPVTAYTSQCSGYAKKFGLKKKEIARKYSELYSLVFSSGFQPKFDMTPSMNISPCTADSCFGVSRDGDLYRCFLLIGEKDECAGSVFEDCELLKGRKNYDKWNEWSPFARKECLECNILPICLGGCGCPLYDVAQDECLREDVRCMPLKFFIDEAIELNCRMHQKKSFKGQGSGKGAIQETWTHRA